MKSLRAYWLGNFYPLTGINLDEATWSGWQFHREDMDAGFAVFFRRPGSEQSRLDASLRDLDSQSNYEVTLAESYDPEGTRTLSGAQLAHLRARDKLSPWKLADHLQESARQAGRRRTTTIRTASTAATR